MTELHDYVGIATIGRPPCREAIFRAEADSGSISSLLPIFTSLLHQYYIIITSLLRIRNSIITSLLHHYYIIITVIMSSLLPDITFIITYYYICYYIIITYYYRNNELIITVIMNSLLPIITRSI